MRGGLVRRVGRPTARVGVLCVLVVAGAACSGPAAPPEAAQSVAQREVVKVPPIRVADHTGRMVSELPGIQNHAERGVAYTHSVFAHCGGRFTAFDSRYWDAGFVPFDAGGSLGYVAGTMTLLRDDVAVFETDGRVIEYRPQDHRVPPEVCA